MIQKTKFGEKLTMPLSEDIPISIVDIDGLPNDWKTVNWHEALEINYILQGSGNYQIGNIVYDFMPGDVFIISNRNIHVYLNEKNLKLRMLIIDPHFLYDGLGPHYEIESLIPYWEFGVQATNLINRNNKYYEQIINVINDIFEEFYRKEAAYKTMLKGRLLALSSILARYLTQEGIDNYAPKSYKERHRNYDRIEPAFKYIRDHFSENIMLCDIAATVNMSSSSFSKIFKKTLGFSPIEYLIRERIARASEMLLSTDESILIIAQNCGFHSISNFIEMFKRYVGKTPSDFRKSISI